MRWYIYHNITMTELLVWGDLNWTNPEPYFMCTCNQQGLAVVHTVCWMCIY